VEYQSLLLYLPICFGIMNAITFSCNHCKIKFQVINISTKSRPRYCPYCGDLEIQPTNIILCWNIWNFW